MNSPVKAGTFAFVFVLSSLLAITGTVQANQVKRIDISNQPNTQIPTLNPDQIKLPISLKCQAVFYKEFTQVPVITNNTNNVLAVGKTIYLQLYYANQPVGAAKKIVLTQSLNPGQTLNTGIYLSGDNNSCKAYY